jgi:hypothetical protein
VWSTRLLAAGAEPLAVHLAPSSCRVVAVRPMLQRPQLLGTSRHITQGADDLEKLTWAEQTNTIRGTSRVVGGDPYEIRFTLPPGWDPASSALQREAGMALLVLRSETNATVAWEAQFQRAAAQPAAPSAPTDAQLKAEGGRATLSWKPSPGAMAYQVFRNGELLGLTGDTTLVDVPLRPKTLFRYEVAARDFTGRLSARTTVGQFKTPPARDAWLEDVSYLKHRQDYGHLAVGQSHDRHPLTLGGTVFKHGLGMHANAETVYALGGGYRRFEARCGVDDEKGGLGSCVFQVWADGKRLFDSGVLRGKQPARQISVDLRGREQLRLVVTDAGDGINCDHADWVDAMLLADRGE